MTQSDATLHPSLVTLTDPRSPIAEAFRQLRTSIQFYSLDRPVRTIMVTSTSPDEGKSSTLANLAIAIAQTGRSVILVDCDLRRPSLHTLFGLEDTVGLTNVMLDGGGSGELPLRETMVPQLQVLPSGPLPPNPSELLGSQRMTDLVETLRQRADYVLFDTPPIVAVTDAAVLAARVDGVLLVLKAGKTKREMAQRAKALLEKVNAKLLGVVLNNARSELSEQTYYSDPNRQPH